MKSLVASAFLLFVLTLRLGAQGSLIISKTELTMRIPPCASGAFAEDTLTIFNDRPTSLDVELVLPDGTIFQLIEPPPSGRQFTLPPGGSRRIKVRYTPPGGSLSTTGSLDFITTPDREELRVDLRGVNDTTWITPSTRSVQFDTLLSCQRLDVRTIRLTNSGTVPITLQDVSVPPPFIVNVDTPLPITIDPGKSEPVEVTFRPFVDGTFTGYVYYRASPCGILDSVRVEGTRIAPSASVSDPDFGEVTAGGSGTTTATVTNNNSSGIRIINAQIVPPTPGLAVTLGQFPIRIPAGGTGTVALEFMRTTLGDIPDGVTLRVDIDSICESSITGDVNGRGIAGGIAFSQAAFDFGELLACQTAEDTITLRNFGGAPVTLSAPVIEPPGAGAYYTITAGGASPGTLQPGETHTIIVRFVPGPGADQTVGALLKMTSSDPLRPELEIPVNGGRFSQDLTLEGDGFDPVIQGLAVTGRWRLINTGTAPVPVSALPIRAPFSLVSTTPPLPATLAPGDTLVVELEFAPDTPGAYADSLRVTALTPCETFSFGITGVAEELVPVTLRWGTATGEPGAMVRIPLILDNDAARALVTSFTASASFNGRLLVPERITPGPALPAGWNITSQSINPESVTFTASGTAPLGGPGEIAYLEARVMLGDSLTAVIRPGDSLEFYSPRVLPGALPGLFTLEGYCDIGGGRLVRADGNFGLKSVRPNPVRGVAEIEFETVEDGPVRLVLHDALGRPAATLLDASLPAQAHLLPLDLPELPNGIYYLELRTPTGYERVKVVVTR